MDRGWPSPNFLGFSEATHERPATMLPKTNTIAKINVGSIWKSSFCADALRGETDTKAMNMDRERFETDWCTSSPEDWDILTFSLWAIWSSRKLKPRSCSPNAMPTAKRTNRLGWCCISPTGPTACLNLSCSWTWMTGCRMEYARACTVRGHTIPTVLAASFPGTYVEAKTVSFRQTWFDCVWLLFVSEEACVMLEQTMAARVWLAKEEKSSNSLEEHKNHPSCTDGPLLHGTPASLEYAHSPLLMEPV